MRILIGMLELCKIQIWESGLQVKVDKDILYKNGGPGPPTIVLCGSQICYFLSQENFTTMMVLLSNNIFIKYYSKVQFIKIAYTYIFILF